MTVSVAKKGRVKIMVFDCAVRTATRRDKDVTNSALHSVCVVCDGPLCTP